MPHLIVKNNITAGGVLAVGQTLRLGSFIMTANSTAAPAMTSRVIENSLHVDSEFAEQMDPMELSSLNELLDCIAALGVATDYDRIGLKPDQREINSPPVTHQIAVVEEQCIDSSSILRTNYVRFPSSPSRIPVYGRTWPNSEPRIGQRTRKIGQHPGARTAKLGSSSAPGSQIGSGFGLKSTHPPKYK